MAHHNSRHLRGVRQGTSGRQDPRSAERLGGSRSDQRWIEASPYWATVLAAATTLCLALVVPARLVLPGLSCVLVGLAFVLAMTPAARLGSAIRYLSAALAFIGFGIAFLTDPELVLPLLEDHDAH
jgi:hypothetical protein